MDYLLLDVPAESPAPAVATISLTGIYYEKVSKRKIGSLPLWHINIGYGRVAEGVFALGLVSKGICAVGIVALGVVSAGVLGIGILGLGALALGLISLGAISVGVLAIGAVALGIFSLGALSMGQFAVGAAAFGHYAALGESARGAVAIGKTEARGVLYQTLSQPDKYAVRRILNDTVPWYLGLFKELFLRFVP